MWLFMEKGFVSVVEHQDDSSFLVVRARAEDDLLAIARFAATEIIVMPDEDYRFCVEVPRVTFASFLREQVNDINYSNLKERLHENNRSALEIEREQFGYRVWKAGREYQRQVAILLNQECPALPVKRQQKMVTQAPG